MLGAREDLIARATAHLADWEATKSSYTIPATASQAPAIIRDLLADIDCLVAALTMISKYGSLINGDVQIANAALNRTKG